MPKISLKNFNLKCVCNFLYSMVDKNRRSIKRKPRGKTNVRKKGKGDTRQQQHQPFTQGGDDDDFVYSLDNLSGVEPGKRDVPTTKVGEYATEAAQKIVLAGFSEQTEEEHQRSRKKRKRVKEPKASSIEFEASRELAAEIAMSSAADQAEWLWNSFQKSTGASSLERDGLTADCLVELAAGVSLEDKLKLLEPQWRAKFCLGASGAQAGAGNLQSIHPKGTPTLLLVSPAALGAIKLIKHCPAFHKACRIAKLFAKHIKIQEQQELLLKSVVCIGAGTPNRIAKLADLEALRINNLKYIVLDTSLDAKQRTILDIPETRSDWWELFSKHLKSRLAKGQTKLALVNSDKL